MIVSSSVSVISTSFGAMDPVPYVDKLIWWGALQKCSRRVVPTWLRNCYFEERKLDVSLMRLTKFRRLCDCKNYNIKQVSFWFLQGCRYLVVMGERCGGLGWLDCVPERVWAPFRLILRFLTLQAPPAAAVAAVSATGEVRAGEDGTGEWLVVFGGHGRKLRRSWVSWLSSRASLGAFSTNFTLFDASGTNGRNCECWVFTWASGAGSFFLWATRV